MIHDYHRLVIMSNMLKIIRRQTDDEYDNEYNDEMTVNVMMSKTSIVNENH